MVLTPGQPTLRRVPIDLALTIRPATPSDAAALVPVFAAWDHPQPAGVIAERLAEWERTERAEVLVAEDGGALAGVGAVVAAPALARRGRFARVVGLAVDPGFRRRGVGAALLD